MRKHVMKQLMTALLMALVVPCVNAQVNVGDILCEGNKVVSLADYDTVNFKAVGVVFYVDDSGNHGWALALEDEGSFAWGGNGEDTKLDNYTYRASAADDLDGYNNTKTILELDKTYPAFEAVDFENGWYLPAAGQLKCLYKNLKDVNASLEKAGGLIVKPIGDTYWSSTEYSDINAWYLITIGGLEYTSNGYNDHKDGTRLVRSVRDF
ncbi:MAG: hypothetical protein J6T22_02685 [Bacteroidales bacterium]|nr:hypothetical protein [Bacteroidales bacterium]